MKLAELLKRLEYCVLQGDFRPEVTSVAFDTRKVTDGACFVCIKGTKFDSHDVAAEAVEKGAKVLIVERAVEVPKDVTVIKTANTRRTLALVSSTFFGEHSKKMKIIGITGTTGKTTTAYMVYNILKDAGYKTGLVGTVEIIIGDEHITASHTTPESYVLQEYLSRMCAAGTEYVVMEVSSQGLKMDRVAGIDFEVGVFTNLEPDHIAPDEHPDFADYLYCKSLLFKMCKTGIGNIDSEHFEEMFKEATCKVITFGTGEKADYRAEDTDLIRENGRLSVAFDAIKDGIADHVRVGIPGLFNMYNALAAYTVCHTLGVDTKTIKTSLSKTKVRGRVEPVEVSKKFMVLLDYAHNGMSLESLLKSLRAYGPKRLVCLFGCGGNRAKDRRYDMGEVSAKLADVTIVTSDNPRFEEPMDIINDIITGINKAKGKYTAIPDRKEAITYCLKNAKEGDVIVVAGKGHEDYQEIKGVKYPMDDRKMIEEAAHELNLC